MPEPSRSRLSHIKPLSTAHGRVEGSERVKLNLNIAGIVR